MGAGGYSSPDGLLDMPWEGGEGPAEGGRPEQQQVAVMVVHVFCVWGATAARLVMYCRTHLVMYCMTHLVMYCMTHSAMYCMTHSAMYCMTHLVMYCITHLVMYCAR